MVTFRPHTLVLKQSREGHYEANGDWQQGSVARSGRIPCRFEPNGRAESISLPDGTNYQYHYTVYLNPDVSINPRYGDIVELFAQDGRSQGDYEVKGVHKFQLGLRIWV